MSDNDAKVEQFVAVTGVPEERARFLLDSASWNLEMALANFYDEEGETGSDVEIVEASPQSAPEENESPASAPEKKKPVPKNSRFATIHTLNNSSDEEEEGQAFYAGGSENSGQQVLGPKKKDIVSDMFKSVKEHGVEVVDQNSAGSSRAFRGVGYKLGQTSDDSEKVAGAPEAQKHRKVTLKLWKNGFSVDDGELRLYTSPANQDFLNSIRRGEIPHELRTGSNEVHVSMEDHHTENFSEKLLHKSTRAFGGQGHTLGNPTPPTVGAPFLEDSVVNERQARDNLRVDTNQPTTNLQIRLADGTRLVGQFNHVHTVEQIRSYIITARPQYETRTFALLSAFPPKELQDSQTIADAGILNSAIIQKLT